MCRMGNMRLKTSTYIYVYIRSKILFFYSSKYFHSCGIARPRVCMDTSHVWECGWWVPKSNVDYRKNRTITDHLRSSQISHKKKSAVVWPVYYPQMFSYSPAISIASMAFIGHMTILNHTSHKRLLNTHNFAEE